MEEVKKAEMDGEPGKTPTSQLGRSKSQMEEEAGQSRCVCHARLCPFLRVSVSPNPDPHPPVHLGQLLGVSLTPPLCHCPLSACLRDPICLSPLLCPCTSIPV